MTMAASQHRERGTLQRTFPSPVGIIVAFCFVCIGASAYLSQYSVIEQLSKTDLLILGIKSGLGVCSSTYSILFSDPYIHLISYAIDLLLSVLIGEHVSSFSLSDVKKVGPAIAIFTLSRLSSFRSICSVLENTGFLNSFNLSVCCSVPLIATIVFSSHMYISISHHDNNAASLSFAIAPSIFVGILSLLILNSYFRRRSHKTGNLTQGQIGSALLVGITIVKITNSFAQDAQSAVEIMPFLIGAAFAAGAVASFAGVADVWYAVGTGQWQMISVDTASIMFYFALPIWILIIRFFEKYGSFIEENISAIFAQKTAELFNVKSLTEDDLDFVQIRNYAYTSLVAFLSIIIAIAIPLVKSMSPVSGYVFGNTFTHGEQNSKSIAVAVHFSELFHSSISDTEREQVWKALSLWQKGASMGKDGEKVYSMQTDGLLNVVVTASDLKQSANTIQMLQKAGHCIAITINEGESSNSIQSAYEEYQKIFGNGPQWYHTGDSVVGDTPTCYSAASKLALKCAKWSIYLDVSNGLSDDQYNCLEKELLEHQGGSIVWLRLQSESTPVSLRGLIEVLNKLFILEGIKMLPTSLSHVIVDKNRMDLE